MVLSSVALAVTGVAIGAGMLEDAPDVSDASADLGDRTLAAGGGERQPAIDLGDREPVISRSAVAPTPPRRQASSRTRRRR